MRNCWACPEEKMTVFGDSTLLPLCIMWRAHVPVFDKRCNLIDFLTQAWCASTKHYKIHIRVGKSEVLFTSW